jgi:hypothetical protein
LNAFSEYGEQNMKQKVVTYLYTIVIAIVTTLLVLLISKLVTLSDALTLGISILAVIFTGVTSFKNELFPFRLSVFSDSLHLVTGKLISDPRVITIQVLLPNTFFNRGYSEGIIETIKLIVKAEQHGTTNVFLPMMEIDMVAFIQQRKGINSSNMLGTFVGFLLEPKRAVKKFVVFSPKIGQGIPVFNWSPDKYTFELYVQNYGDKKPKKYFELSQNIDINSLILLSSGKTQSLFFYPEKYS